jgi:hypothetical protein
MRWYIVLHPRTGETWRPFVVGTSPDEAWARDTAHTWHDAVALGRDEAMLDPDFRDAVLESEAGDDNRHAEWRLMGEVDTALGDAVVNAAIEGIDPEQDPEAYREAVETAVDQTSPAPRNQPEPEQEWRRSMFEAGWRVWELCRAGDELKDGLGRAMAYDLAVQLKDYVEKRSGAKIA